MVGDSLNESGTPFLSSEVGDVSFIEFCWEQKGKRQKQEKDVFQHLKLKINNLQAKKRLKTCTIRKIFSIFAASLPYYYD